jgi:integrase
MRHPVRAQEGFDRVDWGTHAAASRITLRISSGSCTVPPPCANRRCTPLAKRTVEVLRAWLGEPQRATEDVLFPNARGGRLSSDGAQYLLAKHLAVARRNWPSLREKRVTLHVLRHTSAMTLLQGGVDTSFIALWLGHESPATTQIYLDANLALKEQILGKMESWNGTKTRRYRPEDSILKFLKELHGRKLI